MKSEIQLAHLEGFLETLSVSGHHRRFKGFEEDLKGDLNPTFWFERLFWQERKWLDFPDFVDLYWEENKDKLKARFGPQIRALGSEFKSHLAARLYRTQFGFYTEYHAVILSSIVFLEAGLIVERSSEMDRLGVDFTISGLDTPYHIHIFVDSPRAWQFRQFKKENKASNRVDGCHVNFPYQIRPGCIHSLRLLKNGFGVYRPSYVEHLRNVLVSGRACGQQEPAVDGKEGLLFQPVSTFQSTQEFG